MNKPITNTRHKLLVQYASALEPTAEKKMIVSTNHSGWRNNNLIVIALSIHSIIYEGLDGYFKIAAWVNTIKRHTKARIVILLCEGAHLNVINLKHNNFNKTLEICRNDADMLYHRFEKVFSGCDVVYWNDYITSDNSYLSYKNELNSILEKNIFYQDILTTDVEMSYVSKMIKEYPDKTLYIKNAKLDLIEMILGMKVIYEKSCRSLLYPGAIPSAMETIGCYYYKELAFVNVSIKTHKTGQK